MKRLFMEFLGTFFLVFTIIMTGNPLAIGAMLMAWVYIGGHISGAHYNPLVSFAFAIRGRFGWEYFLSYAGVQILAGVAAFLFASFFYGQIALPTPGQDVTLLQALFIEILLSFVFAYVVLTVTSTKRFRSSEIYGFAIGFTILALAILGTPLSGGLFNPAISLGSLVVGLFQGAVVVWPNILMYVGGALTGGLIAALSYDYFTPSDEK